MYNRRMTDFRFFHPIEVRYSDLDPQGHVNHAKYLAFFEQAGHVLACFVFVVHAITFRTR